MTIWQILFLVAFGIVWLAVMSFIFIRWNWIINIGKTLNRASDSIAEGAKKVMSDSRNLLNGNVLSETGDLEFSQLTSANRVLTKVDLKGTVGYYQNQKLAALGNLSLSYRYMDNKGSSLNGILSIYDGTGNNINAKSNNGVVELNKNNNNIAILDIPSRKIFNANKEIIAKISGNLLGNGQWIISSVDDEEICKLSSSRLEWANTINKLDLKMFEKANEEDKSEQGVIDFFNSLTREKNVRWPILAQNANLGDESEEVKISILFLSTFLYVLYIGAYRP